MGARHRAKLYAVLIEIVDGNIQKGAALADEFEEMLPGLSFLRGALFMHLGEVDAGFDRWIEAKDTERLSLIQIRTPPVDDLH